MLKKYVLFGFPLDLLAVLLVFLMILAFIVIAFRKGGES
jgi:hypothetical protein